MNPCAATRLRHFAPMLFGLAVAGLAIPTVASAETLLIDRVQHEASTALPAHGMSMAQVQARYGAPSARLEPRGGQSAAWPVIHRWTYPAFTVYFEKDKVIDAVVNQASPGETGPKPPIR